MTKITIEELKQRIYYDYESGAFINLRNSTPAGTITPDGYTEIQIDGKKYRATHVAHAIMLGKWPEETVDHKDRDPTNNAWDNLRPATYSQQCQNQGVSKRNKLGVRGVSKDGNRYRVRITTSQGEIEVGRYDDLIEAKLARMKAELEHYGVFSPLVSA